MVDGGLGVLEAWVLWLRRRRATVETERDVFDCVVYHWYLRGRVFGWDFGAASGIYADGRRRRGGAGN